MTKRRLLWLLVLPALIVAAVVLLMVIDVIRDAMTDDVSESGAATEAAVDEFDDEDAGASGDETDDEFASAGVPLCLGEPDPGMTYEVGYRVVDGRLGETCFGDTDAGLEGAWKILSDIAPAGQLQDLSSFTGFRLNDGTTLAFVTPSDETGSTFEMAVNLGELEDRWELNLTMLHEFSHVFTGTPNELDRTADEEDCDTYWNSEGCYFEESLMHAWVQEFWADEVARFDPAAPEDANGADQRCSLNPGFFGSYGATSPEEDFAEAFSAFVFQLTADTPAQQERLDWIGGQAGLAEFRDRAVDQGYEPQLNFFEICG